MLRGSFGVVMLTTHNFSRSILQPLIGIEIARQLASHWLRGCRVVILDAPLLFEAKISWLTKPIVVVSCNVETQVRCNILPVEGKERAVNLDL